MTRAINAINSAKRADVGVAGRRALSLCLLFAAAAFPDDVISAISRSFAERGVGPGAVLGIMAFFGVVIGLSVFFYIGSRHKQERIQEELSTRLFGEGCERAGLTRDEMNALLGIVAFAPDPPTKGHLIFESLPLYERCLDAYVEHTPPLRTASAQKEQDELLLRLRKKMGYAFLSPEQPIVSTRNLGIGQKVSVFVSGHKNDPIGATVTHMGEFWFTIRIQEDFIGLVSLGGMEKILAFLRQGDAAYSVTVRVREILQSGEISFFHTIKLSRNQHRQYMRLDINLPLKYRIVERVGFDERQSNDILSGHTADISGGGVCLIAKEPLRVGDVILLSIYIPGCAINGVRSKILKVIAAEGRGGTNYRHLVQFVDIEPQDREKIVKYIFDKHREMILQRR
jgi:c-di-GMP-binding flagellar brake protein YcgR